MAMCKSFRITVEPFMFLCMKAFFLNLVAFPQMILDNVCARKHNQTRCAAMLTGSFKSEYDVVQEEATFWFVGLIIVALIITVLVLPFVASLSDEFGRRRIMFLTPVSQLIQSVALFFITYEGMSFPTWLVLIAGAIPGLVGDVSSLYVFTHAYIADITTLEQRTMRINLLEAASLSAGLCATVSSGEIIATFGYPGIFVTSTGLLVLAIIYLTFMVKAVEPNHLETTVADRDPDEAQEKNERVPEQMMCEDTEGTGLVNDENEEKEMDNTEENRNEVHCVGTGNVAMSHVQENIGILDSSGKHRMLESTPTPKINLAGLEKKNTEKTVTIIFRIFKKSNPISSVKRVVRVLKKEGKLKIGLILFLLMSLGAFTYAGEVAIIVLYLKNHPYFLTPQKVGYFLAYQSALLAIGGLVIWNYVLTRILKISDLVMLLITSLALVAYYAFLGFSNSMTMLYSIQLLHSISTLNVSTIRAMISKVTSPSATGLMFAALLVVETTAVLIGATVTPIVYATVAAVHPGAAFFINAGIGFVSLCISICLLLARRAMTCPCPTKAIEDGGRGSELKAAFQSRVEDTAFVTRLL